MIGGKAESDRLQRENQMQSEKRLLSSTRQPTSAENSFFHRSGAVANMLRMSVATLHVWERRHGLAQPELSPSGQRLYSTTDVRRSASVKQLKELGHAIGSLAPLDLSQLQHVASTQTSALATSRKDERADASTCRRFEPGGSR